MCAWETVSPAESHGKCRPQRLNQSLINFLLLLGKSSVVQYFSQVNHSRPATPSGPPERLSYIEFVGTFGLLIDTPTLN